MSLPNRRPKMDEHCHPLSSLLLLSIFLLTITGLLAQTPAQGTSSVVAGHVTNARTGAPMSRVLVQANGHAVFTNSEGRFQLSDTGEITSVQFTKPGFALSPEQRDPSSVAIAQSSGAGSLEVALWPEAILAGTVSSSEGDPLPRIAVTAQRAIFQNGLRQTLPAGFTLTDAHGGFRLPVPAGDYVLQTRYAAPDYSRTLTILPVQVPGHAGNDSTGTLHAASGQELRVDLHPQLAAAFHVTLPIEGGGSGRLPAISVTTPEGAAYQPPRRLTADGLTLDLPPGVYQVQARLAAPDGERIGRATLNVPDHDATVAPLHLEPQPVVPVIVTMDPAAAPTSGSAPAKAPSPTTLNLQLELSGSTAYDAAEQPIRMTSRGSAEPAFSVAPGSYWLSGGEGSEWTISAASFGGVDLLRAPLVIGPNVGAEPMRLVVSRASGVISGVTHISGEPAGCWIVLVADPGKLPSFFVRRSNADGQFTVSGLSLARYHLLAIPLLSSANFSDPAVLERFNTYVQEVFVTSSTSAAISLDAVPVHELYP